MDPTAPCQRILFVCLGNICRSPLAEGVFREHLRRARLTDHFAHDSAGTGHWHVGSPPDARAIECAKHHGIDISDLRARQLTPQDFLEFDSILGMDRENLQSLAARQPTHKRAQVRLFRDFDPKGSGEVPDPYSGGPQHFERVFEMIERTTRQLLTALRASP